MSTHRNAICVLNGIVHEVLAKQRMLTRKLRRHPELADEIGLQVKTLEAEMDVVQVAIDCLDCYDPTPHHAFLHRFKKYTD